MGLLGGYHKKIGIDVLLFFGYLRDGQLVFKIPVNFQGIGQSAGKNIERDGQSLLRQGQVVLELQVLLLLWRK